MRKCVILLLVLSLLSVGGVVYAHRAVDDLSDQVSFTEAVHSGSLSAAEGLVVELNTQMRQNLFWNTCYPLGGEAKTDFSFSQENVYRSGNYRAYGLSAQFPVGYGWSSSRGRNYEEPDEEDLERMGSDDLLLSILQAVSRNTAPDSEHAEIVRVADYFEYLPLEFHLNDIDAFVVVEEDGYENVYHAEGYENQSVLFQPLQDYFRIPVPENLWLEITMYKNAEGLITSLDTNYAWENPEAVWGPDFEMCNAVTDQGCYFSFAGQWRDEEGNGYPLDADFVPGVYLLPYTEDYDLVQGRERVKYVRTEELRCIYAFDSESVQAENLHMLEEENRLLLTTQEGQTLWLNVIDLNTGERVQKLALMDLGEHSLRHVWYEDGFLLHLCYDNRFVLSLLTEKGYETRISGEIAMDKSMDNALYSDQVALAYNGEKLGIAFSLYRTEPYYDCASSVGVMVYDQSGLLYAGVHISSLDTGSEKYSHRVFLSEKDPITVRWE